MSQSIDLKTQRDRFLAFSFASADILLEVDSNGKVQTSLGATKNLVGLNEKSIKDQKWISFLTYDDQSHVNRLVKKAVPGQRVGPIIVTIEKNKKKVIVNAIRMPQNELIYITIGSANELSDLIYDYSFHQDKTKLLSKSKYNELLEERLAIAKEIDKDTSLTFFDLNASTEYKERIGKDAWASLTEKIAESLNENSLGGDTAGKLSDSRYSLLHEKDIDPEVLKEKIQELSAKEDPNGEGLQVDQKTIDADTKGMNIKNASRAILYTLNAFERDGANITVESLGSSFESYLNTNQEKIKEFEAMIKSSSYNIFFQPIVNLETDELSHYETLSRFSHGNTQEWIMFSEDVGMAAEFDLSVCDKVLNYIKYNAGTTWTKFAVNISGQSICNQSFYNELVARLNRYEGIQERLSFEITESYFIDNVSKAAQYINNLRDMGFTIALDDFGSGSSSFEYLQELNVNYVKIDGKYIRRIRESQKDVAIVKSIASMCKDMEIEVIAEFVEDEEQIKILKKLGIQYGQGHYFSEARSAPDYINKKDS